MRHLSRFVMTVLVTTGSWGLALATQDSVKKNSEKGSVGHDALKVAITAPANNAIVEENSMVSGTFDTALKEDIWVFVWPERAPGRGWPQSPDADQGMPASRPDPGQWSTPVTFGGPSQKYDIAVYTAKASASKRIGDLLKGWAKRGDYPGIRKAELPADLTERGRISVKKK